MQLRKKVLLVAPLFLTLHCGSDSSKKDTSTDSGTTTSTERFDAAMKIISANCASCHEHTSWPYSSDSKWKSSGYVKAGNSAGSELITMLKNAGGTMPEGAAALSTADYTTLKAWIDGME